MGFSDEETGVRCGVALGVGVAVWAGVRVARGVAVADGEGASVCTAVGVISSVGEGVDVGARDALAASPPQPHSAAARQAQQNRLSARLAYIFDSPLGQRANWVRCDCTTSSLKINAQMREKPQMPALFAQSRMACRRCRPCAFCRERAAHIFATFIAYPVQTVLGCVEMKEYIEERVLSVAHYILETRSTVRDAAKVFGVSKSTVHKDMCERLYRLNHELFGQVRVVLDENKAERHIRGGMATHRKYKGKEKPVEKSCASGYDKQ